MNVENIDFNNFEKQIVDKEGIVFLGAGGDPQDWIKGVSDLLNQERIVQTTDADELYENVYMLTTSKGRIDLAFVFNDDYDFNINKMAIWKIRFGDCTWVSDYLVNYPEQFKERS